MSIPSVSSSSLTAASHPPSAASESVVCPLLSALLTWIPFVSSSNLIIEVSLLVSSGDCGVTRAASSSAVSPSSFLLLTSTPSHSNNPFTTQTLPLHTASDNAVLPCLSLLLISTLFCSKIAPIALSQLRSTADESAVTPLQSLLI
jgi:hypothetical protein